MSRIYPKNFHDGFIYYIQRDTIASGAIFGALTVMTKLLKQYLRQKCIIRR